MDTTTAAECSRLSRASDGGRGAAADDWDADAGATDGGPDAVGANMGASADDGPATTYVPVSDADDGPATYGPATDDGPSAGGGPAAADTRGADDGCTCAGASRFCCAAGC